MFFMIFLGINMRKFGIAKVDPMFIKLLDQ